MLKTVEVMCPARVTLFYNNLGFGEDNKPKFKLVNQTINVYDILEIAELKKEDDRIEINSDSKDIPLNCENLCYKACQLFFKYTGIKHSQVKIFIDKKIPTSMGFGGSASDAAGVLIGLNKYYKTNLTERELLLLAYELGYEVPYFIISGYASINDSLKIEKLHNNPYSDYLIIKPNISIDKDKILLNLDNTKSNERDISNQVLHNDFSNYMPDELSRLKRFLDTYPTIRYSLLGNGPSYFVPLKNLSETPRMIRDLHHEFKGYELFTCKNSTGHKTLVKHFTR